MKSLKIKVVNKSTHSLPFYATHGSSGMDIRANVYQDITLQPLERILVPTGLFFEIPIGFEAQLRPRSGIALNNGLTLFCNI